MILLPYSWVGGVYLLLVKFFQFINNVDAYVGAYESVTNVFDLSIHELLIHIPNSYKHLFKVYFVNNIYDSRLINVINALAFIVGLVSWGYVVLKQTKITVDKVVIVVLLLLMPMALNCLYVLLKGNVYQMMFFPYQLFYVICLYPIMSNTINGRHIKAFSKASVMLIGVLSFLIIRFSNGLFYYQKNVGDASKIALGNIIYDIERCEGFNKDKNVIIIEGDIPSALKADYKYNDKYGDVAGVTNLGTTFTYNQTMIWYMEEALGKNYMIENDRDIIDEINSRQEVLDMPCYPSFGYTQMVEDYLVLKFTN